MRQPFFICAAFFCQGEVKPCAHVPTCAVESCRRAMYVQLLALGGQLQTAACAQKGEHEYEAAGIDVKVEIFQLTAAAAQEQDDKQHPCAIATARAAVVARAAATAVVKQTVEHVLPPFCRNSALVFTTATTDVFRRAAVYFTIWFWQKKCYNVHWQL